MPLTRLDGQLAGELQALEADGRRKGREAVIVGVLPPDGERGRRYLIAGEGEKPFLRMNANSYLGLSFLPEAVAAEEATVRNFGTGPGAVRFISGTFAQHVQLEEALARFHGRESAMVMSSAYATVMGVLAPLITQETAVISDALNHNSIINAIRLARPAERHVYAHLDLGELEAALKAVAGKCRRVLVVTDGVFSMRGDYAPLKEIAALVQRYDAAFSENAVLVVDDSHGVGAFGATGRGSEEQAGGKADVLIATLGKALGVNGGYVAASRTVVTWLRETSPFYVYSNPISPGEAAAAARALQVLESPQGLERLRHLKAMTQRFATGLAALGFETIPGEHPIVPLLVRDTAQTAALVQHLRRNGVLATGLAFPVVPRGDEEIRFQISADHTATDIDEALGVLARWRRE